MYGKDYLHYIGPEAREKGTILKRGLAKRFESAREYFNLDANSVILDTETTGLSETAQLIEICILDFEGNILLNERVKPSVKVSKGAREVHGIKARDLKSCRSWPDVYREYVEVTAGKNIVAYNAKFDRRIITQTCRAFNLTMKKRKWYCLMLAFSELVGRTRYGDYKWHKLSTAAWVFDVPPNDDAHSAYGDCETTLAVAKEFLQFDPELSLPLEDYKDIDSLYLLLDEKERQKSKRANVILIIVALIAIFIVLW
jgi:DNA polymerase III epsilon subunit-like protein